MPSSRRWVFWGVVGLVLLLLGVAYYPTLRWLVVSWLGNSYYRVGFLVPVISLLLAWRLHRSGPDRVQEGGSPLLPGALVIAMAMLVHIVALRRQAFLVSAFTFVVALAGLVLAVGGMAMLKRQAFPLAFLLLAIPLPILETCTPALAQGVAQVAGTLARLVGIPVVVSGARLDLPDSALAIAAPCSGLNSIVAFVSLAALYAFLVRGPLVGRVALVILSVPIALLANLSRVGVLVGLSYYVSVDFALRYFHIWSSLLLFLVGVLLFIIIGQWLRCDGMRSDI